MKSLNRNWAKKITLLALVIIFSCLLVLLGIFNFGPSGLKQAILGSFPVPIALVEGQIINSSELYSRVNFARSLQKNGQPMKIKLETQIFSQLVYESKLKILAQKKGAKLNDWAEFALSGESQKNQLFENALKVQGFEDSLKFWFFSQKELNRDSYDLAAQILAKIHQNELFGELAKQFSQDTASKALEGDLGPVAINALMFELKEPLLQAKLGELRILPSRLGLHIILPYFRSVSETGEDVLHLKQIYLPGADFPNWVGQETKNYKVTTLVKL